MNENRKRIIHDIANKMTLLQAKARKIKKSLPSELLVEQEKLEEHLRACIDLVLELKKELSSEG